MRFLSVLFIVWCGLTGALQAATERRVALVIGNSAYENVAPLPNPVNDAAAVAAALERLGFEVILGLDLDHRAFVKSMKDYARRLQGADLALFYYAGHGLQVSGTNYLAPVNTELADEIDLEFETVRLDAVIGQMEKAPRTSLIFLDACRNNPLARNLAKAMGTRSVDSERGLAAVETGVGTLIAYSTQPGNVAYDGQDEHSPFSAAFLDHVETPGADIAMVLRRVRQQVINETAGRQVPWSNSSLTGDVILKPGLRQDLLEFKRREEEAFWIGIKDSTDPLVLENYLKRFPDGAHTHVARERINELSERLRQEQQRVARMKAQAEQQASDLLVLEAEREKLLEQLQAGTVDHEKRLQSAKTQVAIRERELEELTLQNRRLRLTFEETVAKLETQLNQAEDEQAARENEVARLTFERDRLETERLSDAEVRQSLETAIGDASKSARETAAIRAELNKIRSESEKEIADQTKELASARMEVTQAREEADSHQKELRRLQQEREAYVAQYTEKLRQSERERKSLEDRLAALSNRGDPPREDDGVAGVTGGLNSAQREKAPTTKSVHLDRSGRIALQMALKEFGYDPGPADGNFGPKTFQAIMGARLALNLPVGSHIDQTLIGLLPDVSKLYGAYDGEWVVVRTAANPGVCGWSQVKQRLKISRGSITGPGYIGEIYSNGAIEMTRSFILRHKKRQSVFTGQMTGAGGRGSFAYAFNDCRGTFALRKGSVVSLSDEDFYRFDKKDRNLVRSIQTELNRLGCDVGGADGVWGAQSKRGLQKFSAIRSQQLDQPYGTEDLLALLQQAADDFCSSGVSAQN